MIEKGGETFAGYNKPKKTPNHPKKSHAVLAKIAAKVKLIRFGQQGVSGSPKKDGESKSYGNRRKSFQARHAKNISKGKMSAAYWANKVKWSVLLSGNSAILLPWLYTLSGGAGVIWFQIVALVVW